MTERLGHRLKRAAATLRGAVDRAPRPYGPTVPQYACLELLDRMAAALGG